MTGNEWLVLGMIGGFLGLMLLGIPVAISLAVSGFVAGYLGFGPGLFNLMPARLYGVVTNYTLLAIPPVRIHGRNAGEIQSRRGHAGDHWQGDGWSQWQHGPGDHPRWRADGCLHRHCGRHRSHRRTVDVAQRCCDGVTRPVSPAAPFAHPVLWGRLFHRAWC